MKGYFLGNVLFEVITDENCGRCLRVTITKHTSKTTNIEAVVEMLCEDEDNLVKLLRSDPNEEENAIDSGTT